jgi:hypothetical protein
MPYKHFADNKWIAEIERLQRQNEELLEALKKAADRSLEVRAIMESHGIIFDKVFQDKWQQVAFTLYTMIVEAATEAEDLIARGEK